MRYRGDGVLWPTAGVPVGEELVSQCKYMGMVVEQEFH